MRIDIPTPTLNPSRYAWVVVALLWFVALLNYLDRLMIASMRDPIRADIHMTDAQFGLLTSAFLWVYAAVSPFGGFLSDRVGRRGVITASLLFWSGATLLSGFGRTFNQLLISRALMGVSEACYIPAALAMIADYHRGRTRSLATGLHMTGIYTGAALGGVGGYIAEHFGWRYGFRIFGGVGIAYSLLLLATLRDAPHAQRAAQSTAPPADRGGFGATLTALFQRSGFRLLFTLNLMVGLSNWSINVWLPTYLRDRFKMGLGAAGISATAYIQIASFAGVLIGGALADRWARTNRRARAIVPAIGYCLAGPCLVAAASTDLLFAAVAGLLVFGLGRGAFDANQMPIVRELVDERHSATAYGVLNFISTIAGGLMVYAGGALKDANVDLARIFQVCGAGLFAAGILLFAIRFPPKEASRGFEPIIAHD